MRLRAAAAIIAAIVLVGFFISVPRTSEAPEVLETATTSASVPIVVLKDAYKKGTHTITGSVEADNACARVSASATHNTDSSSTERIVVAVVLEPGAGICLEVPTRMNFTTTVAAPAGLPLEATVNGAPATTTTP
jgi:hypothetical protein